MVEGLALGWGDIGASGLVVVVVLLILTDKLRPAKRADRELAVVEKQRDDAVEALRESHEVARINAESIRDLTASVEQLADGQEVAVNLIRAALPSPVRERS